MKSMIMVNSKLILSLVLIIICLVVFLIIWPWGTLPMLGKETHERAKTQFLIGNLMSDLELYWLRTNKLPKYNNAHDFIEAFKGYSFNDYKDFISHDGDSFIDGWGTPLIIEVKEDNSYFILSLGLDKIRDTKDDISERRVMDQ